MPYCMAISAVAFLIGCQSEVPDFDKVVQSASSSKRIQPTAASATFTTNKNTAFAGTLSGTADPSKSKIFVITVTPSHGTVSNFNSTTGGFTYTPTSNYVGNDQFSFVISTGDETSNTAIASIQITNGVPSILLLESYLYPLDGSNEPIIVGQSYDINAPPVVNDADGDNITWSCAYKTVGKAPADPNYVGTTINCTNFNSAYFIDKIFAITPIRYSGGTLLYRPMSSHSGTYQFTLSASDGSASDSKSMSLTVRESFDKSNVVAAFDASMSSLTTVTVPSGARVDGTSDDDRTSWEGLLGSEAASLTATFASTAPWTGVGSTSSPYSLLFNSGTNDALDFGSSLNGLSAFTANMWIKPTSVATANAVILGNRSSNANGIELSQSSRGDGSLVLRLGTPTYAQLILADRPLAYWKMEETSGTLVDSSTNGHNGTIQGTITSDTSNTLNSVTSTAADFDGTTNYVTFGNYAPLKIANFPITVEAWVYLQTTGTYQNIISHSPNISSGYMLYVTATGAIDARIGDGAGSASTNYLSYITTSTIATGAWHHVAAVYKKQNDVKIFVDGVQQSTTTSGTGASMAYDAGTVNLGYSQSAIYKGIIDEVAVYDYNLTATQIKNHYVYATTGVYPDTIYKQMGADFHAPLNETSGTTAYDDILGNNGTYSGTYSLGSHGPAAGHSDYATYFNGTNGKAAGFGTVSNLSFVKNSAIFTISFWAKLDDYAQVANGTVIANTNGALPGGFVCIYSATVDYYVCTLYGNGNTGGAGTSVISDNGWHHIVFTGTGTKIWSFLDGVKSAGSANVLGWGTGDNQRNLYVGIDSNAVSIPFAGSLADIAVFDRVLTDAEVLRLYQAKSNHLCRTNKKLADNTWENVAVSYTGTAAKVYIQGKKECEFTPSATFSGSTDLHLGDNGGGSNYWKGNLMDYKLYTSSDDTTARDNYAALADRLRDQKVEPIVTSGLKLHFDPANAKRGVAAHANGCAGTDLYATNLAASNNDFQLKGVTTCATYGWQGSGTLASPYRFSSDPANFIKVDFNDKTSMDYTNVTAEAWFKVAANQSNDVLVMKTSTASWSNGWGLFIPTNTCRMFVNSWNTVGNYAEGTTNIADNTWHHCVGTYDGTTIRVYVDGELEASTSYSTAISNVGGGVSLAGQSYSNLLGILGDLGPARVYNRALDSDEVLQNYVAQASRFLSSIKGLQAWYAADFGVTTDSNGYVTGWSDLSGNGLNLSSVAVANSPTLVTGAINSHPVVRFDGLDSPNGDYLQTSSNIDLTRPLSLFVVSKNKTRKNYNGLLRVDSVYNQVSSYLELYWAIGSTDLHSGRITHVTNRGATTSDAQFNDVGPAIDNYYLVDVVNDTATNSEIFINGTSVGTSTMADFYPDSAAKLFVGIGYGGSTGFLDGDIAEILIFNRHLKSEQRKAVECYLSTKWALTVSGCP